MKILNALVCLIALSGCATTVYQPEVSHFENMQNRSAADVKLDEYHCGMDYDGVDLRDMDYFNACMEHKGYKRVVDRAATTTEQPFKLW